MHADDCDPAIVNKARELARLVRLYDRGLVCLDECVALVAQRCGLAPDDARRAVEALLPLDALDK